MEVFLTIMAIFEVLGILIFVIFMIKESKAAEKLFNDEELISSLKGAITSIEDDYHKEQERNETYQKDLLTLVETNKKLINKITDLQNNIEFIQNKVPELQEMQKATKKMTKKRASSNNQQ